jgi:FdrA protein
MAISNVVHKNAYFDSVALMRVAARISDEDGVETASLTMGTDANREILQAAGLLTAEGKEAGPNDLIVAVKGDPDTLSTVAALAADQLLAAWSDDSPATGEVSASTVRRLVDAPAQTNLAMISTPGRYAAAEALKALKRGCHVFIFSDNVPVAHEVMLKQEAAGRGLLVMGPDCGTAIINGHPLGFANAVRRGDVGLIGASGTGLQQVSTLLHEMGAGVSQVIGVGSNDVSTAVGGLSMLTALDALAADPETRVIALVSKPPAPEVTKVVLAKAARANKPVVVNFLGASVPTPTPPITVVPTLREAARSAAELSLGHPVPVTGSPGPISLPGAGRSLLRALYAGGTFAHEAAVLLQPTLGDLVRTAPAHAPGADPVLPAAHTVLDLGDDRFTAGRPHPMIDPTTRVEFLRVALASPDTAVVVLDVVLGHGASDDPAGALVPAIAASTQAGAGPAVVAFVVGTHDDPQDLTAQQAALRGAGAIVVDSSTTAVEAAADIVTKAEGNR